MKKRFSSVIAALSAIVLAVVMASGCSFINTMSHKNSTFYSFGDSEIAAQSVNFETTPKTRNVEDALVSAVEIAQRTSVQLVTSSGAGSGVIVDITFDDTDENSVAWKNNDNMVYIITCHHMISKSDTFGTVGVGKIEVRIPDEFCNYDNDEYIFYGYIGNEEPSVYNNGYDDGNGSVKYAVTLVGGDYESDIAILKLDLSIAAKSGNKLSKDKIEKAQIPDSSYRVRVGETVFSVGNPTGTLPGTVASGIVSYLARRTSVSEVGNMTLMQIDVSTNPGSSGGGLYNLYGELIGITNAGNTNYTNINFAIPCYLENGNGFVEITKQLAGTATENNYGYVTGRKVKFGFTVSEGSDNGSSYLYVSAVTSGSIAANSKLQQGDEIVTVTVTRNSKIIASQNVTTVQAFGTVMDVLIAGDVITLDVSRTVYTGWGRPSVQSKTVVMTTEGFRFCNTGNYSGDGN